MANVQPQGAVSPDGGRAYQNSPGVINYRPLRLDHGNQNLFWQPCYQGLIRQVPEFSDFFPQAEFRDGGDYVVFRKFIDGKEVVAGSRGLSFGEAVPKSELLRLEAALSLFRSLASTPGLPEDNRLFIERFAPPSIRRFPSAYRLYKTNWWSKPRLALIWGMEPVGSYDGSPMSAEQVIEEARQASPESTEQSGFPWRAVLLLVVLLLAIPIILWFIMPSPSVDFEHNPERPAVSLDVDFKNLTKHDGLFEFGTTTFAWTFEEGVPSSSSLRDPRPVRWAAKGVYEVQLVGTTRALFGLIVKRAAKSKSLTVDEIANDRPFKPFALEDPNNPDRRGPYNMVPGPSEPAAPPRPAPEQPKGIPVPRPLDRPESTPEMGPTPKGAPPALENKGDKSFRRRQPPEANALPEGTQPENSKPNGDNKMAPQVPGAPLMEAPKAGSTPKERMPTSPEKGGDDKRS